MSREPTSEDSMVKDALHTLRKQRIEPVWDSLNEPDDASYEVLWRALQELGCTTLALPEELGDLSLGASGRCAVLRALGAAAPALGAGLVSHLTAQALLREAAGSRLRELLDELGRDARCALIGSPLDAHHDASFVLAGDTELELSGCQRVALPMSEWLVVPALRGTRSCLLLVSRTARGVRFASTTSSHGLRLIPFGLLSFEGVRVAASHVFDWPMSGNAANEADGLITALLAGMVCEMAQRASAYAVVRYQGGKMIHEHDAVRQLVGPMHLAVRSLDALAQATLEHAQRGDGGASAFAIELVRRSGLDAIQTFGGYGYMEDYRVERYLRDANTLETIWIHAAARERAIAAERFGDHA